MTVFRRNWPDGDLLSGQRYATWYELFDERQKTRGACLVGAPARGDLRPPESRRRGLLPLMIEAEGERMLLDEAERT